jgi:hypothetical protein
MLGRPPADRFSVFGYHLTGLTGTLFLLGIAVGAVASLGLPSRRRESTRLNSTQAQSI